MPAIAAILLRPFYFPWLAVCTLTDVIIAGANVIGIIMLLYTRITRG